MPRVIYYSRNGGTVLAHIAGRDAEYEENLRASGVSWRVHEFDDDIPMDGSVVVRDEGQGPEVFTTAEVSRGAGGLARMIPEQQISALVEAAVRRALAGMTPPQPGPTPPTPGPGPTPPAPAPEPTPPAPPAPAPEPTPPAPPVVPPFPGPIPPQ